MSDDKIKRRRFLADILFAGGAISAAALLAKATQAAKTPQAVQTPEGAKVPVLRATPEPQMGGAVVCPQTPVPPTPDPAIRGDFAMPTPAPQLGGEPTLPATPVPKKPK